MQKIVEVPGVGNVEFPDSMSDADIGAVIQKQHPALTKSLEQRQSESKAAFDSAQGPWYSRLFNRAGLDKAKELAGEAVFGIPQSVTGIPSSIVAVKDALNSALTGNLQPAERMATSIANPVMTPLKQGIELVKPGLVKAPTPDDPETAAAASGAGAFLGGAVLGEAAAGFPTASKVAAATPDALRAAGNAVTSPEALMTRAAANRTPSPKTNVRTVAGDVASATVGYGVAGKEGAAVAEAMNLVRRSPMFRNAKASVQEAAARLLAGKPKPVTGVAEASAPAVAIERPVPVPANNGIDPTTGEPWKPGPAYRTVPDPVAAPRPGTPNFIQQQLDNVRQAETPESLFDRMKKVRDAEVPSSATAAQTVAVPRPVETVTPEKLTVWDQIRGRYGKPGEIAPDAAAINKWMNVPSREVLHGANPGQQLLDERLIGATKEETLGNVTAAMKDAGLKLQSTLEKAGSEGKTIDAQTPTYSAWAKAEKRIGAPKDATFNAQSQGIVDDIEAKYPNLEKLTPAEAHSLKVDLGDAINWFGDDPINKQMIDVYRELNSSLKKIEGVAEAQSRWGNLYTAMKNLHKSIAKDTVGSGTGPTP